MLPQLGFAELGSLPPKAVSESLQCLYPSPQDTSDLENSNYKEDTAFTLRKQGRHTPAVRNYSRVISRMAERKAAASRRVLFQPKDTRTAPPSGVPSVR